MFGFRGLTALILKLAPYFALGMAILLFFARAQDLFLLDTRIDASIYRAIGHGWLQGDLPYIEYFDHKGPIFLALVTAAMALIDFYNGPVFLALLMMGSSILMLYLALQLQLKHPPLVALGVLVGTAMVPIPVWQQVTTESYSIFFTAIALWLIVKAGYGITQVKIGYFFSIGLCCGVCLMILPKNVELFLGLCFFWSAYFITQAQSRLPILCNGLWIVAGTALVMALCMGYFYAHDALMPMIHGWLLFNFTVYTEQLRPDNVIFTLIKNYNTFLPLVFLLMAGVSLLWFLGPKLPLLSTRANNSDLRQQTAQLLFLALCSALGLFLMLGIKGAGLWDKYFIHGYLYYTTILTIGIVLAYKWLPRILAISAVVAVLFAPAAIGKFHPLKPDSLFEAFTALASRPIIAREQIGSYTGPAVAFLTANATPEDTVYVAGQIDSNGSFIYGFSQVKSPTRYFVINDIVGDNLSPEDPLFHHFIGTIRNETFCQPPRYILVEDAISEPQPAFHIARMAIATEELIPSHYRLVHTIKNVQRQTPDSFLYRFDEFDAYKIYEILPGHAAKIRSQCVQGAIIFP